MKFHSVICSNQIIENEKKQERKSYESLPVFSQEANMYLRPVFFFLAVKGTFRCLEGEIFPVDKIVKKINFFEENVLVSLLRILAHI